MKTFVPPLKCQGIKTKLVPWIRQLVPPDFERWIEPFMGSGVVGLNIKAKQAIFADSNPHIIAFYAAIQSGEITPDLVRDYLQREGDLLRQADENGYQHYRFIRERFNTTFQPLDFLFLSRAGFNGMMRFSKAGRWNIPFCKKPDRFAPAYVTKITNQTDYCANVIRPEWKFLHQDYLTTIQTAQVGDLIYCDPPYLGRYTDYYNNWTEENEQQLAQALRETPARFILSSWHHNDFRENINIKKYWSDFQIVTRDHYYHSGAKIENRNPMVEALIFNFEAPQIEKHNHEIPKVAYPLLIPQQSSLFLFD